MKKLLTIGFLLLLTVSLTACQKVEDWEKQKNKTTEETTIEEVQKEEPKTEETKKDETSTDETKTEEPKIEEPKTEEPATEKPVVEESKPQEIKTFNITAKQFEFTPNTISVNEGDKVVVNMTSQDVDHGFAITEYNINVVVAAGETKTIEFTADKKGTFTFKCPVYCGEGHLSMTGNLIVN